MADAASKRSGRLKTIAGALAGIVTGGLLMYATPLLDKVIKPPKPLANFAVQTNGLQIVLHNRSIGGDGFWDFGDGSALEPARIDGEIVTHTYTRPGQYMVKLTIRNFLGEENERSAPVLVKGSGDGAPAILALDARPVCPRAIAPATFRVTSKAQNVETCVWDFGADRPLEISSDSPEEQERLVTFPRPGQYQVQLAVLNGKRGERRSVPVVVEPAPANALMAVISSADCGSRVDSRTETVPVMLAPDAAARGFERSIPARPGYTIADARLDGPPPAGVRNVAVFTNADRSRATVSGELSQRSKLTLASAPPMIVVPVVVRYERTVTENRETARSTTALTVPGTTVVPLACCPDHWVSTRRAIALELFDGSPRPLATLPVPCTGTPITWRGQRYFVTVQIVGDQVIVAVQ